MQQKMYKWFTVFFLIVVLMAPVRSRAAEYPWSLGVMGGLAVGLQVFDEIDAPACIGIFCGLTAALNSLEQYYSSVPLLFTASYQFSDRFSLRGGLGIDVYHSGGDYYDGSPRVLPAFEAMAVLHLRRDRIAFHPYLMGGLRFPLANLGVGFGNEFYISKRVSFPLEVLFNSIGVDNKLELRLGASWHF